MATVEVTFHCSVSSCGVGTVSMGQGDDGDCATGSRGCNTDGERGDGG